MSTMRANPIHLLEKKSAAEIDETGKQEEKSNGSYAQELIIYSIDVYDLDSKESIAGIHKIDRQLALTEGEFVFFKKGFN